MCGIAGIYEYARSARAASNRACSRRCGTRSTTAVPTMRASSSAPTGGLAWRHRRLSIVDLEHGHQPMQGEHGTMLVFNGEIYNYPAPAPRARARGRQFATRCDTEVILHLYARHGRDCVEHLNGMFAFALWDARRRELFFARDRARRKAVLLDRARRADALRVRDQGAAQASRRHRRGQRGRHRRVSAQPRGVEPADAFSRASRSCRRVAPACARRTECGRTATGACSVRASSSRRRRSTMRPPKCAACSRPRCTID